jgi:hypothetical protein
MSLPILLGEEEEGNHKAENCHGMVTDLEQSNKDMGFSMSLNVHLLDSH